LDYLSIHKIFVMEKGEIVEEWWKELIKKIWEKWFES
jgi:hypothetical protein